MKIGELIEELSKFDKDANIITYNRTSHRWFKTGDKGNYPVRTVADTCSDCGDYAKKQLSLYKDSDVTFFF